MAEETIVCECGCGEPLAAVDSRGRRRRYKTGHNLRLLPNTQQGYRQPEEKKRRIAETLKNNPEVVARLRKMSANKFGKKFPGVRRSAPWLVEYNLEHGGENHHNWKGGISAENYNRRRVKEYRRWRDDVIKRDDYTCRECGDSLCELHAHHIKEFARFPELRYVLSNGITLCKACHYKKHYGENS